MPAHDRSRGSPVEITQCLGGTDFPRSRDELIRIAEEHKCAPDTVEVLQSIPEKRYKNMADVMSGLGEVL